MDLRNETVPLSLGERKGKNDMEINLKKLLRDEELKWRQRAREQDMKEGDANTKYFHLKASGRRKKTMITVLQFNGEVITGDDNLLKHITDFYKELFDPPDICSLSLDGLSYNRLSEADRRFLTSPFTLKEIKSVVFGMKHNKDAGPDGFPAEFYQTF